MTANRWWRVDEIVASADVRFDPRRLGHLLRDLIDNGAPCEPLDAGE
jgi:hypothetical protein